MKYVVAAVYDSKSKTFSHPQVFVNQAVAQRCFSEAASGVDKQLARYPTDYTFFLIGTYDDELGEVRSFPQHINLGLAASYIKESHDVREIASQSVGDEALVLTRTAGGNSEKLVRPESRAQDDV